MQTTHSRHYQHTNSFQRDQRSLRERDNNKLNLKRGLKDLPENTWQAEEEEAMALEDTLRSTARARFKSYRRRTVSQFKKYDYQAIKQDLSFDDVLEHSARDISLIPLNSAYEELTLAIESCFKSQTSSYVLLMGSPDNGKASAVYYAIENAEIERKNDLKLVEVDAMIHNTESKILSRIQTLIIQSVEDIQGLDLQQENTYTMLTDFCQQVQSILFIKNVDVFARQKRQTFLYSLLDHINSFSDRCMVIFSTNYIFFPSLLEKRVKSRLSFKQFNFFGYQFEKLLEIIEDKVSDSRFAVLALFFNWAIDHEDETSNKNSVTIKGILKKYFELGVKIGWFMKLFRIALMYIDEEDIADLVVEYDAVFPGRVLYLDQLNEKLKREKRLLYEKLKKLNKKQFEEKMAKIRKSKGNEGDEENEEGGEDAGMINEQGLAEACHLEAEILQKVLNDPKFVAMDNEINMEEYNVYGMKLDLEGKDEEVKEAAYRLLPRSTNKKEFCEKVEKLKDRVVDCFSKAFERAVRSLNMDFEKEIYSLLPKNYKDIVTMLYSTKFRVRNEIKFGDFFQYIWQERQKVGGETKIKLKAEGVKQCLIHLENLRIVFISRKPINNETKIVPLIGKDLIVE